MEEIDIEELLKNVQKIILESDYIESEQIANELEYTYSNYLEYLNIDFPEENNSEFDETSFIEKKILKSFIDFDKYVNQDKSRFAFLITVYELFILPLQYIEAITDIINQNESLKDITFETGASLSSTNRPKISIEDFEKLGKELFPAFFLTEDFIKK